MNIALVTAVRNDSRFFGAENLYRGLEKAIVECGYFLKTFPIRIDEASWEGVLEGYLKCYDLNLEDFDLVISTKGPTYMVRHPFHVSYLVHTMRVFYDMFEAEYPSPGARVLKQRKLIHAFDNYGLTHGRTKKHYAIGNEVASRLRKWNRIEAAVLHPAPFLGNYQCKEFDYIFMPGRLHRWKRVDLMIRAMKNIKDDVRLLIAGSGEDERVLKESARDDPRIEFLGYVDDSKMPELYANSLIVPILAKNEDYGMVTVEAMKSKKPVITCADSGEPLAFVKNGETGFVVPPDPEAVAERIKLLVKDRRQARVMGQKAFETVRGIRWENVVRRLISDNIREMSARTASSNGKTKVFVTDNQMLTPAVGGGRIRILHLYKDLPAEYDVTYVGAHDHPGPVYREQQLTDNFREIVVPLTQIHFKFDDMMRRLAGKKIIIDVTMPVLMRFSPRFIEKANLYASKADIVIVAHPWVFPWIKYSGRQLLVYDSQNCEYLIKKQILNGTLLGKILVHLVKNIEKRLCVAADLIITCSESDKENYIRLYGVPTDKIQVVPNGVSISDIRPAAPKDASAAKRKLGLQDAPVILFVGSGYEPNTEALAYIAEKLAPALPDCAFAVVGGVKDSYLRQARKAGPGTPANVKLYGTLDTDARNEVYAASDVAINPMFRGSGTNIKMLDFFAAGLPVVSTPVGARGIEMQDDVHGILCEAHEFPARINSLLANPEKRCQLGSNARALAEEKYDWKVITRAMVEHYGYAQSKKGTAIR